MYDVAIIGCGIIGASTAYELSRYKLKVAVLEAQNDVANGTTKANSAILHAGYDPEPGTLMAKLNVEGVRLAKELCEKLDVERKQIGSFVLAFSEKEMETVHKLYDRGVQNGVPDMKVLTKEEVLAMEPNISTEVHGALYAPSAAIVNPWEFCIALAETAVRNGVEMHLNSKVTAIEKKDDVFHITTASGEFEARYVVNAAGVYADKVHEMVGGSGFHTIYNRGEYYMMDKSQGNLVNKVVFQCPSEVGKGVLVSPTVHGNLIVGPNAVNCAHGDDVDNTAEGLDFVRRLSVKSVPSINFRDSIRNFAGVRANTDRSDFIIEQSPACKNFINLGGIKSPGLSSAPAIGKMAVELLKGCGLETEAKEQFIDTRKRIKFRELDAEGKKKVIAENPLYGRVICRCETITEGEIVEAIHRPIVPRSIDAIKRRCNAGMGRCQGGFCGPRVHEILARELGVSLMDIQMDEEGSYILTNPTKQEVK
ncbi:NAD(P)/FAD-dependent oxidoreductase [Angelakisella massiliensis]|uniref:NAD(P)/FAD-dependent oxidoreductase n=1 Tax=Angelakisella massiliensis TaxID=1871018 RepID=UPI0008F85BCD|nr:NAD(P)/FAD-dependent oxidoreductase [Angelakisella massiliensis]